MSELEIMGAELMSVTTGGLPYPESSADINQGANDVKALALALESRGGGRLVIIGEAAVTFNAAIGNIAVPTPFKAGTTPRVIAAGGAGSNANNKVLCLVVASVNNAGCTVSAMKVPNAAANAWATGGEVFNITYFAMGTAP